MILALLVIPVIQCNVSDSDNNMRREFDSLKENVEAKMKTMEANNKAAHAESESAIERLRTDNVKAIGELRTDMAQLRSGIFIQMVGVIAAAVAILGGFIAVLRFFT